MQSFIAQPEKQYRVGEPICRSKRRCDVIEGFNNLDLDEQGKIASRVFIRPMTWFESLKHELFGKCEAEQGAY